MTDKETLDKAISKLEKLWIAKNNEVRYLKTKLSKIKSICENERMLQLTDMINEVEDVVKDESIKLD